MSKLSKTEKALLKAIVDTNYVKPHHVRKSGLYDDHRFLYMSGENGRGGFTISHAIKPRLFSGLKVGQDYVISELLEEEE